MCVRARAHAHTCNEGLAHIYLEAERSHGVLSATRSPSKTDDRVHSKSRLRRVDGINPSHRAGKDEMRCPSSNSETE